jgi:hypothetical protein
MRISEHRYTRDRRAFEVATRLIDFEARTSTIRGLTGLSDDRIRSLSKECGVDGRSSSKQRRRGASPSSVGVLLGKPRLRDEAGALLSLCRLMGLTAMSGIDDPERRSTDVSNAERLCDAYWTFRYLLPEASISFEHMLLLLSETAKGGELAATHCSDCHALFVVDALSLYDCVCPRCTVFVPQGRGQEKMQYRCVAEEAPAYI